MYQSIVEAVFAHAHQEPNRLCLADDSYRVTYGEYVEKIQKYASVFSDLGLCAGDKAVIEATQTIDYLGMELALQLLGVIFVPVEYNCAVEKIQSFIERTNATIVISRNATNFTNCRSFSYAQLQELAQNSGLYEPQGFPDADDISEILFSTGTTGKEKGIILTHKNDIALAQNVMYGVEMDDDTVEMIPSPLNHSHGLRRYYANMYNGSSVILLGSVMDIMRFFRNIETYQVNAMDLVPTALSVVLRLSKEKLADYKNQLRYIQLGAAPLMEQDKEKICRLLPHTRMYNFYGSTESGCTCIYNFNTPNSKQNCIGKPTHNTTVLMVDDEHNSIDTSCGTTGCLATLGSMNMLGYWEDEEETRKVLDNGIVYSNDIAYMDEDGDIILLGRKGDVINVGGNKVSPEEIENVAKQMPEISDCGCIPVPDSAKGNVPKLFVQMASNFAFDPIAIRSFLANHLEPYKVPAYIEQIDRIPRSYNGKLLRKELKN